MNVMLIKKFSSTVILCYSRRVTVTSVKKYYENLELLNEFYIHAVVDTLIQMFDVCISFYPQRLFRNLTIQ